MPRLEISLDQIQENTEILCELYGRQGISLMGVSKAVLGEPAIAQAMIQGGVKFIADSHLENIQKMKAAGLVTRFVLLRTAPSQAEAIIESVDISLNTELETLQKLSYYAKLKNKPHQVILMVELGDLREGILPCDLAKFVQAVIDLPHIAIVGIGCNLACHGGIKPDSINMNQLTKLVRSLEQEFQLSLEIISGGNSANYEWYQAGEEVGKVNNLRLGESILLGCETVNRTAIPGLHTHAFQLVAEVIEAKQKPSLPVGQICQDAFGQVPQFHDYGLRRRVILALGRQDILMSSLTSDRNLELLGSSSDHMILNSQNHDFNVGDEVHFHLDYGGLLAAMTSPFISKAFVPIDRPVPVGSGPRKRRNFAP